MGQQEKTDTFNNALAVNIMANFLPPVSKRCNFILCVSS